MATQTIFRLIGFRTSGGIQIQKPDVSYTYSTANEATAQVYQSILPLKGKYANVSLMNDLLKNIDDYNRELIEAYKE